MAKVLTDREVALMAASMVCSRDTDCGEYKDFLEDLSSLVARYCGGNPVRVDEPPVDEPWTVIFDINDDVPPDGGLFARYDTDVTWKNGEET